MGKINEMFKGAKNYISGQKTKILVTGAGLALGGTLTAGVMYGEDIKNTISDVSNSISEKYRETEKSIYDTINDDPSELLSETKNLKNDWKESLTYFSGDIKGGDYVTAIDESKVVVKEILGYLESMSTEKDAGENLSEDKEDLDRLIGMFKKSESYLNNGTGKSLVDHLGKSLDALNSYIGKTDESSYLCDSLSVLNKRNDELKQTILGKCGLNDSLAEKLAKESCPPQESCPEIVCPEKECYLDNLDNLKQDVLVKVRRDIDGKMNPASLNELLSIDALTSSLDTFGKFNHELLKEIYNQDKDLASLIVFDYITQLSKEEKLEQTVKLIFSLDEEGSDRVADTLIKTKELDFWLEALEKNYGLVVHEEDPEYENVQEEELKYQLNEDNLDDKLVPASEQLEMVPPVPINEPGMISPVPATDVGAASDSNYSLKTETELEYEQEVKNGSIKIEEEDNKLLPQYDPDFKHLKNKELNHEELSQMLNSFSKINRGIITPLMKK
jgi:hypothetical protein